MRARRQREPTAHRGLRAAVRLPLCCARGSQRIDRLVVLPPLRRRRPCSAASSTMRPGSGRSDPSAPRTTRRAASTCMTRWCWRPRSPPRAGRSTLTDALAVGRNERGHGVGAGAVGALLRRVSGVEGSVDLELVYEPRPEYGLVSPLLEVVAGGITARRRGLRAGAVVVGAARHRRVHRGTRGSRSVPVRRSRSLFITGALRRSRRASGARWRSEIGSPTPRRRGGRGRACTRVTTARGPTWCARVAECCTG